MLYGHLNPEHLVKELVNLAATVWRVRNLDGSVERERGGEPESAPGTPQRVRKRQKRDHASSPSLIAPEPDQLFGLLDSVRIVVIHCKEDIRGEYDKPINVVIADQVRDLVEERGLGAEIVAAAQGMHICPSLSLFLFILVH
ncbi:hypothetical protein EUX98_g2431 [Antrodiella citrinella]|uniref:Uncharacterized protein n=1 Tax=Antrodiella citrinella TaxID=2447956 RepID=A0A4S4MZ09_9APHY|nr:hypothetical protein EUX98_g2431 [Antrodiella citrinella]